MLIFDHHSKYQVSLTLTPTPKKLLKTKIENKESKKKYCKGRPVIQLVRVDKI